MLLYGSAPLEICKSLRRERLKRSLFRNAIILFIFKESWIEAQLETVSNVSDIFPPQNYTNASKTKIKLNLQVSNCLLH